MTDANDNGEIVRTIVTLARNLGMEAIAEGVETEAQNQQLKALGCEYAQGYLFSRPVESQSVPVLLVRELERETALAELPQEAAQVAITHQTRGTRDRQRLQTS
jgi:predicted signal transduction protein with EAL and GGDEF domain